MLFGFDPVYSTPTVLYTDRERSFDSREVLKVFCEGWDRETFDLSEDEQLEIREERDELVRTWLRRALRQPGAQATVAALAKQGVVPVFTGQVDVAEFARFFYQWPLAMRHQRQCAVTSGPGSVRTGISWGALRPGVDGFSYPSRLGRKPAT